MAPCYKTEEELAEAKFGEMQEAVQQEFSAPVPPHKKSTTVLIPMEFFGMKIAGQEYVPKFQQLNEALDKWESIQ